MLREATADVMRIVMRIFEFIGAGYVLEAAIGLSLILTLPLALVLLVAVRWAERWARD